MSKKSTLLLIDGNSLFHRAYHALPPLSDGSGENANAVFGFSNMLLKAINEVDPGYIACAFDTKAPTFRHVEFEQYKAQRPPPPADLYPQLPKVKKILNVFGVSYFEKAGYEADDILATISQKALKEKDMHITILSGDRDVLQLVNGKIKVQMPGWNLSETTLYGSAEVKAKYGLETHQMVDYKSLIGDPSDNVPGIAGIGPKNASTLLQKYHTLEGIYKNISQITGSVKDKLILGKETALAAKKLVELDRDVKLEFKFENLKFNPNWENVRNEYLFLGFKSIVSKVEKLGNLKEVKGNYKMELSREIKEQDNKTDQLDLL